MIELTDILIDHRLVSEDQIARAMAFAREKSVRLDQALVQLNLVDERQLLQVIGEQLGLPVLDLMGRSGQPPNVDLDVLRSLPAKLVYRQKVVPVSRHNGSLTVATSDPFDMYGLDELRMITGLHIEPALATREEIDKVIKTHYGVGGETLEALSGDDGLETADLDESSEDLLEQAQEASVVKLVNQLLVEAINERASDIHIEPYEHDLKVRFRIDGVLQEQTMPPTIRRFMAAIISRIKIMAHLNIAERRLPQDGRIKLNVGGRQVDIRVSVIPMLFGEGVVMRVLDRSQVLFTLPELGMDERTFGRFENEISKPHGIILVTGPTGSGKTTTLYAALQAIVDQTIKVITVEDPVEYHLDGVNQIQIQPRVGLSFAAGLRSILRHDPDVVMIGEIRDRETAEAAIQASLTGHLVLSTLHTNDAAGAATRLIDMGIEPFLVTSTLNAAMAQRLVRKICPECKESYEPDRSDLPEDLSLEPGQKLYRGRGCRACRDTGYRGRIGLYELLTVNQGVRDAIRDRASTERVIEAARTGGLRLLREEGWTKVLAGVTTIEEVLRSTKL